MGGEPRRHHDLGDHYLKPVESALESVIVETGPDPQAAIVWMHGLGADGHDFEPLVPELLWSGAPKMRFVFPHAPVRPVSINNGYAMRAWYDILAIDRRAKEDAAGIETSATAIGALVRRENERGISSERIVLAGFSQGGAMALHTALRYPEKLAGIIALSCYLPLARELEANRAAVNQSTPIFMAHGTQDPVVPYPLGEESRRLLESGGHQVEWRSYAMPHSLCAEEVAHLQMFLRRVLG